MRTCLVIIDMQNGFINEHTEHLVPKIIEYTRANKFDKIVGTRYINHPETACYIFEKWHKCLAGTEQAEIVDSIKNILDATFDKDKYSCWNKEFRDYLELNEIDRIYFVGVNTGCCVLHSVFDAYNDLQDCMVISSLCGSTSGPKSHECALQILRECITEERVLD